MYHILLDRENFVAHFELAHFLRTFRGFDHQIAREALHVVENAVETLQIVILKLTRFLDPLK